MSESVAELKDEIAELKDEIEDLQSQVSELKCEIIDLESSESSLNGEVKELEGEIRDLEIELEGCKGIPVFILELLDWCDNTGVSPTVAVIKLAYKTNSFPACLPELCHS